ncbi:TetR/AcrR family transcriptional regulator [Luteimonas huabeiensis]|uniref:TetR/AcrR family transcriptional regulator n=1 Tax=Luteimonas huabeiensis TaxID=1244513 RepID=UPI000467AC9F|nr:TetR/AcrR family transcriptional regulator [Luteimonas huabeiensis]
MTPSRPSAGRKRIRLKPEIRTQQILHAVLAEFSQHGFAAARIEDIAARAGLSKSGIYAHYAGKDEIFEALLMEVLSPQSPPEGAWEPDPDMPLPELVESYIQSLYGRLQDPVVLATFRLLIAESERAPGLIRRWHAQTTARRQRDQAFVDACVRRGVMRPSALTEHFELAVAPVVMWMNMYITLKEAVPMSLAQMRQAHARLLLDVLQPR